MIEMSTVILYIENRTNHIQILYEVNAFKISIFVCRAFDIRAHLCYRGDRSRIQRHCVIHPQSGSSDRHRNEAAVEVDACSCRGDKRVRTPCRISQRSSGSTYHDDTFSQLLTLSHGFISANEWAYQPSCAHIGQWEETYG